MKSKQPTICSNSIFIANELNNIWASYEKAVPVKGKSLRKFLSKKDWTICCWPILSYDLSALSYQSITFGYLDFIDWIRSKADGVNKTETTETKMRIVHVLTPFFIVTFFSLLLLLLVVVHNVCFCLFHANLFLNQIVYQLIGCVKKTETQNAK